MFKITTLMFVSTVVLAAENETKADAAVAGDD